MELDLRCETGTLQVTPEVKEENDSQLDQNIAQRTRVKSDFMATILDLLMYWMFWGKKVSKVEISLNY